MTVNREDQNTFLMIFVILVVCLIALVAILSTVWQIIRVPVEDFFEGISYQTKLNQPKDYNFTIPQAQANNTTPENTQSTDNSGTQDETPGSSSNTPEATDIPEKQEASTQTPQTNEPIPAEPQNEEPEVQPIPTINVAKLTLNYNFAIPAARENPITKSEFIGFSDAILDDALLAEFGNSGGDNEIAQPDLRIRIPKISIDSPVYQGLGADHLLKLGFWIYPGSYGLGEGEVVMLCHRRYWGPYHPHSCWFLDKVAVGDEIFMNYNGQDLTYRIAGVNVFDAQDPLIYTISEKGDYIKIVTCTPLYSNKQRLVVLAERVK
jgi:LPXTG-site transpeptidase (sortase) family protein